MKIEALKKITVKMKEDKKLAVMVGVGFLGILLLLVSELWSVGGEGKEEKQQSIPETSSVNYGYAQETQDQLKEIISNISGAGETKVMVTLDCGEESVFAVDDENDQSETSSKIKREYIIIEPSDGNENGLILKVIQPKIRGVAVVCEGGDSSKVQNEIIGTVTAVLGISPNRVYISKLKT